MRNISAAYAFHVQQSADAFIELFKNPYKRKVRQILAGRLKHGFVCSFSGVTRKILAAHVSCFPAVSEEVLKTLAA